MSSSAIDPKAIPGIVETLGIVGSASLPAGVSLDDAHFVYDLGAGGFARLSQNMSSVTDNGIVGVALRRVHILGPRGSLYFTIAPTNVLDLPVNARAIGQELIVAFDAAGAAGFATKTIRCFSKLFRSLDGNSCNLHTPIDQVVVAGTLSYRFFILNAALGWNRLLLSELSLAADIQSIDATVFPANTTLQISTVWMSRKLGGELPY